MNIKTLEDIKKEEIGYRADTECCYYCNNNKDNYSYSGYMSGDMSGDIDENMSLDTSWCTLHKIYVDNIGICRDYS